MTWAQLAAFNVTLVAAMFSPGPALLVAVGANLSGGRRAGFAAGCGLGLAASTWTLLALAGFAAVFEAAPAALSFVRAGGGLVLLVLAVRMWRGADRRSGTPEPAARRAFRQGLLVNLWNPKAFLFAAAVLIAIFPGGLGLGGSLLIAANHLLIELSFYALLSVGFGARAVADRVLRRRVWIDRVVAAILGTLGLQILLGL